MISNCFNPECRRQLDYLRTGRVVRSVKQTTEGVKIEHFWLCGECCLSHDLRFLADGSAVLSRNASRSAGPRAVVRRSRTTDPRDLIAV